MILLKGKDVSEQIGNEIREETKKLNGYVPFLAIVRVGEKPDDISYEKGATKKIESFGFHVVHACFEESISDEMFGKEFARINASPEIDGILLLRPLPKHLSERKIEAQIDPAKDLDGICPVNIARVFAGDGSGFAPCTAEAVIETLKRNGIGIAGKRVTIVGRSMVVGRPLAMLFLKENATVTVCHTKTADLKAECRRAEILAAAAGKAKMIDGSFVGRDAVVLDVGINVTPDGKLCGDVDTDSLGEIASMATPVPGGIGAVTTAVLARHLLQAALRRRNGQEPF